MRILFGYFFIALSVFLLLALLTFQPSDSSWLVSSANFPLENIAGGVGANLSAAVVILYGKYAGYFLCFGFFVIGIHVLSRAKIGKILIKATLFFISTISLSVLTASFFQNPTYVEAGLTGLSLFSSLSEVFPPVFIGVLFGVVLFLSLLSNMKLFQSLTKGLAKAVGFIFLAPFELFGLIERKEVLSPSPGDVFISNPLDEAFDRPEETFSSNNRPAPDFLRPEYSAEFEKSGPVRMEKLTDGPEWLQDESRKGRLLSEIKGYFDEELGESIPLKKLEEDILLDEVPHKMFAEEAYYQPEKEKKEDFVPPLSEEKVLNKLNQSDFIFPGASTLEKSFDKFSHSEEKLEVERVSQVIENTFESFKINIKVSGYSRGPAITRYEIVPPSGLKIRNIVNLTDDLALNLGTRNIRIVAPIGNKSIIGVEVPNQNRKNVVLRDIIESDEFRKTKAKIPLILGKDITGNIIIEDLTEMPHLLIAGTTGSGKSVYVNSLIGGIVFTMTSDEVKFIFIDPKMVELELYNGIPYLLAPVITSPEEAIGALEWASAEMDRRYKVLSDFGVRNFTDYNREIDKINAVRKNKKEPEMERFPYIVIVIDEFANLILRLPKETEKLISRIAAMARAVGIHLVIATQRPSVDVVTGIIKANFPSRITFRVSSQTDSRTILDKSGAEKLLGKGDLLFMTPSMTDMVRIQAPFVSNQDVENIVRELKRNGTADYVIDLEDLRAREKSESKESENSVDYRSDPVFADSLKAAVENGEVSASYLQRRFRIGYNRAARIIEAFEKMKILGPVASAGKGRQVLIGQEDLVHYLDS
jgi:S-DNA-T family DNA segregation ATPase FtsK/SpoIIIE